MEQKGSNNNSNQQNQKNRTRWVPVSQKNEGAAKDRDGVRPFSAEWAALRFLDPWDAGTLEMAIERDERIPLSSLITLAEDVIIEQLLDWFASRRPDLYEVLATERGVEWLRRNLRTMQGR